MSDRRDPEPEGWDVPVRAPLLAMLAVTLTLAILLPIGGRLYVRTLAPALHVAPPRLPAPRLETGGAAPGEHRADHAEPLPPRLSRAIDETAAQGDALWGAARP